MSKTDLSPTVSELERLLNEAGLPELAAQAHHQLKLLQNHSPEKEVKGKLLIYNGSEPKVQNWAKEHFPESNDMENRWLLPVEPRGLSLSIEYWESAYPAGEALHPLLAVLVLMPGSQDIPDIFQHIESMVSGVPMIVVAGAKDMRREVENKLAQLMRQSLEYQFIEYKKTEPELLEQELNKLLTPDKLKWLKRYADGLALDNLKQTLLLLADREGKNLIAKRQVNQQQLAKLKLKAPASGSGLLLQLKTNLQNQLGLFEKGASQRIEQAFRGNISTFWQMVDSNLNQIESFTEETLAKSAAVKLHAKDESEFLEKIRRYLFQHGQDDLKALKDNFDLISHELESFFRNRDIPYQSIGVRYGTLDSLEDIINPICYIERPFRGELRRQGGYEYFMAIRRYQILLMMVFSSFGLSFVSKFRAYMIPATLFLFGIGIYNVVKTVQQERAENMVKQLERARESLKMEAKRISGEFARAWARYISIFLQEQNNNLLQSLEAQLKNMQTRSQEAEKVERSKYERIQVGLETQERRLENFRRNLGLWERNLAKTMGDMKKIYLESAVNTKQKS